MRHDLRGLGVQRRAVRPRGVQRDKIDPQGAAKQVNETVNTDKVRSFRLSVINYTVTFNTLTFVIHVTGALLKL